MCRNNQGGNSAVATVASVRSVPQEVAEEQLGDGVKPASRKAASGQLTEADVMQAISNAGEQRDAAQQPAQGCLLPTTWLRDTACTERLFPDA